VNFFMFSLCPMLFKQEKWKIKLGLCFFFFLLISTPPPPSSSSFFPFRLFFLFLPRMSIIPSTPRTPSPALQPPSACHQACATWCVASIKRRNVAASALLNDRYLFCECLLSYINTSRILHHQVQSHGESYMCRAFGMS
jgi:hypothetical protein